MDPPYQAYAVLTMCRLLHALVSDGDVPKDVAARWCVDAYPQFALLIEGAQKTRRVENLDAVLELIEFVGSRVAASLN
jgi:hypothetical protein